MVEKCRDNQFGKISQIKFRAVPCDGRTILEDVYFTAPYKIMKPFEKKSGGIQVMPLCASAGLMSGDVQRFHYHVCEGADIEIISQSFEKIHKMNGGTATREICIKLEKNAVLSYYPQPVIPFADSSFESDMLINLEDESSKLFLADIISCGRSACGERFEYRKFCSKVKIYRGEKLIYFDNTRFEPGGMPMENIGLYEGYSHLANIFMTVPQDAKVQECINDIIEKEHECECGVTKLAQGDLAVRIIGNRAQKLQEISDKIKNLFL